MIASLTARPEGPWHRPADPCQFLLRHPGPRNRALGAGKKSRPTELSAVSWRL